jgi:hypothetical protein
VRTDSPASLTANASGTTGLSALREIEVAELLRAISTLHLDGLLSDAEYQDTRRRLVASH